MLVAPIVAAYVLAAILVSPYLYYMFALGHPGGIILNPMYHGADLVNLLIPTSVNEMGRPALFRLVSRNYLATLTESGAYVALPLIAIASLYCKEHWSEPTGRILIEMMIIAGVLAMGTRFVFAGHPTVGAPWLMFAKVPLLDKALPVRLMAYVFLALALMVAIWFSSGRMRLSYKWLLGVALVVFTLPNLSARFWESRYEVPEFFASGLYRQFLRPNENVMTIPGLIYGDGMQWQVATGMYFRLADPYTGLSPLAPPEYARWPIMSALYDAGGVPQAGDQLKALLAHEGVSAIVVGPLKYRMVDRIDGEWTCPAWVHTPLTANERTSLEGLLSSALGVRPVDVGGVELYRIPPAVLAPYLNVTSLDMRRRYVRARFDVLLRAGYKYLAGGGDPAALSSDARRALALERVDWFGGPAFPALSPNKIFQVAWVLGQWHQGKIAVGVQGSYEAVRPLIDEYGPDASAIYFPFPQPLKSPPTSGLGGSALMVMEFTPEGLARAASAIAIARSALPP